MQEICSSNPPVWSLEVVIQIILEQQKPSQFETWLKVEVTQHLNSFFCYSSGLTEPKSHKKCFFLKQACQD